MRLKRARNVLCLTRNVQNRVDFWGSAPDPAEGAYDAPSDSLVVRGFLPSAIAASGLRRLQHPVLGGGIASITQGGWTPLSQIIIKYTVGLIVIIFVLICKLIQMKYVSELCADFI